MPDMRSEPPEYTPDIRPFYRGKRYIDVTEKAYLEEVDKLYSDEKKRKKRVNNFFFRLKIKGIPHKILSLFKRSKNYNKKKT